MGLSPEAFNRVLSSFDPLLRVRWGKYMGQWIVERKASIPGNERQFLRSRRARMYSLMLESTGKEKEAYRGHWRQIAEEDESGKSGYRVILTTDVLDNRVINTLMFSDIRQYGGYSRMADEWEKYEQTQAAERKRVQRNEDMARHSEVYDVLNFLRRRRGAELDRGETDLQVLLK